MDTFVMLEELLEQDQFELLPAKEGDMERRLVYLMNDAVESFLVFRGAALTGHYLEDYEGALTWSMSRDATRYVLVVRQGDNAVTLLFENLDLEVHLYNYGEIAHFWVPEYEYLRQLEYRIAILRDKCEYLGPEYCTPEERRLAHLAYFPSLNYCCYPAVPAKYIVPIPDPWNPSEEALNVMEELARECGNKKLGWRLKFYRRHPWPLLAKRIEQQAEEHRQELARQGIRAEVLREEPFTIAQDNLEFQVYLMIWETRGRDRRVRIETIK